MAKCLYSYRDDLPKSLFKITAEVCKKESSDAIELRTSTGSGLSLLSEGLNINCV